MTTFKDRSCIAKLLWILILPVVSTILISSQVSAVHGIPATTLPLVVKITYPHKGQQVGIGHNVTLLGTSSYNASSKCQVSIILDKKRPYQNTIPIGQGADNYSQWKYTLSPTYTAITEGTNRVTAKLICNANPALTKFYSINLTGINQPTTSQTQPQQRIAVKSNGTTSPFFLPSSISLASAVSNSTLASSNSTNTPSVLPVSINGSSLIDPSSTQSSSSSSSGHSHIHHHSHQAHHSSSSGSSSSSSKHHSSSSGSSSTSSSGVSGSSSGGGSTGGKSGSSSSGGGTGSSSSSSSSSA